jgi:hypothetical protein
LVSRAPSFKSWSLRKTRRGSTLHRALPDLLDQRADELKPLVPGCRILQSPA